LTVVPPSATDPLPTTGPQCRLCGGAVTALFEGPLLTHRVRYEGCSRCGYVQTETPYWLDEAYADALNTSDTGIVRRSARTTRIVASVMTMLACLHEPMLDFAGGSGLLVRMLRDLGVDARWHDPHCANVFARGFEHAGERVALITAFEVLEHFEHPLPEIERLAHLCDAMLFSTELVPTPTPAPDAWWYYGREHGQHIGFFRLQTLALVAERLGWHLHSDGRNFHLFTRGPLPAWRWALARNASKPLYWLARARLDSRTRSDHRALTHKP